MERTLHDKNYAEKILRITSDTLILVDKCGTCIDIDTHSDLWFLQEDKLLGNNLFELLPVHTLQKLLPEFQKVIDEQASSNKNYKLAIGDETYYFKCIMYPFEGMVLCQYRDITARNNVKLQLERTNYELKEIQKAAQIGQWKYSTSKKMMYYQGYTDILCTEIIKEIKLDDYLTHILAEDRDTFKEWLAKNEKQFTTDTIEYRLSLGGIVYYIRLQSYFREEMPDGDILIEGYIQNITDIQRRRNDINTLTHAINNAKESIFAAKKDGTVIFANKQFKKNHHIPEKTETSQMKIYEIVADMKTQEDWKERCGMIKDSDSSEFLAFHPSKKDKNALAFEGTIYSITTDDDEETFWSFTHDISDRIRYESEIKRLNQIMDTTMKNIPAGIVVKDVENDFRYVYRNRESHSLELRSDNITGVTDFDYYPQEIALQKRKEDIEIAATKKGMHWITEKKRQERAVADSGQTKDHGGKRRLLPYHCQYRVGYYPTGTDEARTDDCQRKSGNIR